MRFSIFQVSRRGGREKNEDRMGYCYTREAGLFILADGMGGHPEGEVAAQLSLQAMAAKFQREATPVLPDPAAYLRAAILQAHHQLLRYAESKGLSDTPRTTIVACVLQGQMAHWAHCGDSRLYFTRGGKLIARTRDHSYSELNDALGRAAPGAERFNRNVLFTCLGSPGKPMVDIHGPMLLEQGDRLLLCSDGLWGTVGDPQITQQLASRPIADAVPDLVEQALRNGGARCDNVTALAVEWDGAGLPVAGVHDDIGDAGFASTIQADSAALGLKQDTEAMDNEEIDRSVREINDAIRRSGKKPKT